MFLWGGSDAVELDTGARYDPALDAWTPTTQTGAPSARSGHTAVWRGSATIVWGGGAFLKTGGRYDPVADAWTPTSTTSAPWGRYGHSAVWTGSKLVVW